MRTCKEISELVSTALDRDVTLRERFGIRFHLMFCTLCRHYSRQLRFLHAALHQIDDPYAEETHLSPEARDRIRRSLEKDQNQ